MNLMKFFKVRSDIESITFTPRCNMSSRNHYLRVDIKFEDGSQWHTNPERTNWDIYECSDDEFEALLKHALMSFECSMKDVK